MILMFTIYTSNMWTINYLKSESINIWKRWGIRQAIHTQSIHDIRIIVFGGNLTFMKPLWIPAKTEFFRNKQPGLKIRITQREWETGNNELPTTIIFYQREKALIIFPTSLLW